MIAQALLASTAIVLLSFISEDAATISSALSLFGGPINWQLGFAACFAGIWLGDLGLYSLERCFGKPLLQSRWITRFAIVTAFAALLWIGGIFAITKLLGSQALIWLSFVQSKIAAIALTAVV